MPKRTIYAMSLKQNVIGLLIGFSLASMKTGEAASMTGQVLSVETGSRISLSLASGQQRKIQLIGTLSPPSGTSAAKISRRHLQMLVAGKFVTILYQRLTPTGEILGQVLHGGSDINLRMLEAGLVLVDTDSKLTPEVLNLYRKAQRKAEIRRLGLWAKIKR